MIGDLTSAPEPIADQAVLAGPRTCCAVGARRSATRFKKIPGVVDVLNGIENTISGPAVDVPGGPERRRARRLHAAGSGTRRAARSCRANRRRRRWSRTTAPTPSACAFPTETAPRSTRSATRCWSAAPGRPPRSARWRRSTELPGQTEIRRENLQRDVAVTARLEGHDLGDGHGRGAAGRRTSCTCRPRIRVSTAAHYEEQQKSFHDLVFVLVLAIVLVFIVLLFEFGNFAAPVAILSSALLSTSRRFPRAADHAARRSTSLRSWD